MEALRTIKHQRVTDEDPKADIWCHFGRGLIRGPDIFIIRIGVFNNNAHWLGPAAMVRIRPLFLFCFNYAEFLTAVSYSDVCRKNMWTETGMPTSQELFHVYI